MAIELEEKQVFSSDIQALIRLDRLHTMYRDYILNKDLENAYWTMRSIRCEFAPMLNIKKDEQLIEALNKKLKELETARKEFCLSRIKPNPYFSKFMIALEEFDIFINQIEVQKGIKFNKEYDLEGGDAFYNQIFDAEKMQKLRNKIVNKK